MNIRRGMKRLYIVCALASLPLALWIGIMEEMPTEESIQASFEFSVKNAESRVRRWNSGRVDDEDKEWPSYKIYREKLWDCIFEDEGLKAHADKIDSLSKTEATNEKKAMESKMQAELNVRVQQCYKRPTNDYVDLEKYEADRVAKLSSLRMEQAKAIAFPFCAWLTFWFSVFAVYRVLLWILAGFGSSE